MALTFIADLPPGYQAEPIIISGKESLSCAGREYILLREEETTTVYEIRFKAHASPFKEAILIKNILGVGHEEHFYLFDINLRKNLLALSMGEYFGHIYNEETHLYVTDAFGVHSIDLAGKVYWSNSQLGIDGIIIDQIDNERISGEGEWDPPGGWHSFILDKKTGHKL